MLNEREDNRLFNLGRAIAKRAVIDYVNAVRGKRSIGMNHCINLEKVKYDCLRYFKSELFTTIFNCDWEVLVERYIKYEKKQKGIDDDTK